MSDPEFVTVAEAAKAHGLSSGSPCHVAEAHRPGPAAQGTPGYANRDRIAGNIPDSVLFLGTVSGASIPQT